MTGQVGGGMLVFAWRSRAEMPGAPTTLFLTQVRDLSAAGGDDG